MKPQKGTLPLLLDCFFFCFWDLRELCDSSSQVIPATSGYRATGNLDIPRVKLHRNQLNNIGILGLVYVCRVVYWMSKKRNSETEYRLRSSLSHTFRFLYCRSNLTTAALSKGVLGCIYESTLLFIGKTLPTLILSMRE